MKKKIVWTTGVLVAFASVLQAQTVVIDSLESTGKLTATVPSNSVYTVEWIDSMGSAKGWQTDWSGLREQVSTDGAVEVEVPMAYRLTCWTNGLFLDVPVGRTYHYSITNQVGETWQEEVRVMGDSYMPAYSNHYRTIWTEEWYDAPDLIPDGAQSRGAVFLRVDEEAAYVLDSGFAPGPMTEDQIWKNGPVGTTWSYVASAPHTTVTSTVVAVEDVTIGSTTYEDCLKIRSVGANQTWLAEYPIREYTEWVKPGGYVVKRENSWVHYTVLGAIPVVYELQSWEDL
ncbi:hypothetical protein [Pontiella sp.]|uniref:hypothetical protein n=1 Tax=Pontiella sp. TaxID=2837462 RepID=UPI003569B034